jgi:hypothetical protein
MRQPVVDLLKKLIDACEVANGERDPGPDRFVRLGDVVAALDAEAARSDPPGGEPQDWHRCARYIERRFGGGRESA